MFRFPNRCLKCMFWSLDSWWDSNSFETRDIIFAHDNYYNSPGFQEATEQFYGQSENKFTFIYLVFYRENLLHKACITYIILLQDIELALENNYPEALKPKLILRQSKAEALLPTQEKVDFFTPVPSISKEEQNPLIQSATNKIKIEHSSSLGRHIVATKDIEAGEIIAIEKPFCNVLTGIRLCFLLLLFVLKVTYFFSRSTRYTLPSLPKPLLHFDPLPQLHPSDVLRRKMSNRLESGLSPVRMPHFADHQT